jgi:hypothetical protein
VLDTVIAQHQLVRSLLAGCPERFRTPLLIVDSNMAATLGGYLFDMGHPDIAKRHFDAARRAAHDAHHRAYAAYAAASTSAVARLTGDTPTALDAAAAARSLAARTNDHRLKAYAEQIAAGAYAMDDQYDACVAAFARAHEFLVSATSPASLDSPTYWVHHGTIGSHFSKALILLNKPGQAVETASNAHARYDRTYIHGYAMCEVRLGHALILAREITEATHLLANAAPHAHLSPRLTAELHTARARMQPWAHTSAVKTLDSQLHACGLTPARRTTPAPPSRHGEPPEESQ